MPCHILVHFQPGYLFGLLAGFTFSQRLPGDTTGRLTLLSAISLLAVGLLAWVARSRNRVLFPVPFAVPDGAKLTAWSRVAWGAIFAVALFCFVEILLQPSSGYLKRASSPRQAFIGLMFFIGLGLFSVAFWAYFRFRPADRTQPGAQPGGSPVPAWQPTTGRRL